MSVVNTVCKCVFIICLYTFLGEGGSCFHSRVRHHGNKANFCGKSPYILKMNFVFLGDKDEHYRQNSFFKVVLIKFLMNIVMRPFWTFLQIGPNLLVRKHYWFLSAAG